MERMTNGSAGSLAHAALPDEISRGRAERQSLDDWTLKLTYAEKLYLSEELAPLTGREREVVFAICEGGRNEAIAERLYIALPTLRTHLMRVYQKLGARSKSDVVRFLLSRVLEAYRDGRLRGGAVSMGDARLEGLRETGVRQGA